MANRNFLWLLGGFAIGVAATALVCYFIDPSDGEGFVPAPTTVIDIPTAKKYSEYYDSRITDDCLYKQAINVSKAQFETMETAARKLREINRYNETSGFRLFYAYSSDTPTPGSIKSLVYAMDANFHSIGVDGRVYMVDLPHDVFSQQCPPFCDSQ